MILIAAIALWFGGFLLGYVLGGLNEYKNK